MKKNILIVIISLLISIQVYAQRSTTGPNRPIGVSKGIVKNNNRNEVIISGVPAYLWHRGCAPTSLGMLIGYYDTHGLSDLIDGYASIQTSSVNDAIANDEHYNDYSLPLDYPPNILPDKSELGGAHTSNCIADFMKTSWSSESLCWGWSWIIDVDNAFNDYVYMRNSTYETYEAYEHFSISTSWDVFTNEINNNRPVILSIDSSGDGEIDHASIGIGYDESNSTYAVYDTWDYDIHWYEWREMSTSYSWGIYGFDILKFQFNISASANPTAGGTVSGVGTYDYNETVNMTATASTDYDFVNWTENGTEVSTNANYSFTITENRTLIANFAFVASIDDLNINTMINMYPNPVIDEFIINNSNNLNIQSIQIYDILGKLVTQEHNNFQQIDVSSLKSGLYLVKIETDKGVVSRKIIKE